MHHSNGSHHGAHHAGHHGLGLMLLALPGVRFALLAFALLLIWRC